MGSSERAWNEIPDYGENENDTTDEDLDLSAEERAEKLSRRASSKSITEDRLMGAESGFFDPGYLHDKPLVEYLSTDEVPRYFFFSIMKVRV